LGSRLLVFQSLETCGTSPIPLDMGFDHFREFIRRWVKEGGSLVPAGILCLCVNTRKGDILIF